MTGRDTDRSTSPVAIIGASGALGFGLAIRLGRAGVPIVIGSRDAGRVTETVQRTRAAIPEGSFFGCDNTGAVHAANTVILSVPFLNQAVTFTGLKEALRPGQLLIDLDHPLEQDVLIYGDSPTDKREAAILIVPGFPVLYTTVLCGRLSDLSR